MNVRTLLIDAGCGPWLSFPQWEAAVIAADAIASTISDPINRAAFVARAAGDLLQIPRDGRSDRDMSSVEWATGVAQEARRTPCGSTELWGALV